MATLSDFVEKTDAELKAERSEARIAGNFATADRIRDELRSRGVWDHDLPLGEQADQLACAAKLTSKPPACTLPHQVLKEHWFTYDPNRYPFARLVAEMVGSTPPQQQPPLGLERLHQLPEARSWIAAMHEHGARPYAMRRNIFDQRFKAAGGFSNPDSPLSRCYVRFVRDIILPMLEDEFDSRLSNAPISPRDDLGDAGGGGGGGRHSSDAARGEEEGELLYQVQPNFRCHLAGTGHHLVQKHRDSDYFHQPNELNFWMPLTPAFGANTLWAESSPGAEDFRPYETNGAGTAVRFWGGQCAHFTVPNDTDVTRVSIDFRVIPCPRKFYLETYEKSHRCDGLIRFGEGAYFKLMRKSGADADENTDH